MCGGFFFKGGVGGGEVGGGSLDDPHVHIYVLGSYMYIHTF